MTKTPLEVAMGDMKQTAFAEHVGASQQLVSYWLKTGRVGGAYVLKVEAATGISRHVLRPDIFGPSDLVIDHADPDAQRIGPKSPGNSGPISGACKPSAEVPA